MGNICSCSSASQVNAGSILDRVISQASDEDQCILYRLANYKKGGELIDAYNRGGQIEVEQLIKTQFGVFMYALGKGQVINRAEYLRWKFRDLDKVVLPIEASLSRFDPLAQWNDHEACWQMQYRGSLGETLLHVLIICDTRSHTRIARTLIKCFPRLAIDVVEGEEYLGAGALHLAIAYNNNELVQDLVEAGAIVNQRAIGSFFLPKDQQGQIPAKNTDYEGLAYLGEYPLAWAACCANESVYNLLLDSGADPDEQDSFGNMILHMVVVGDKLVSVLVYLGGGRSSVRLGAYQTLIFIIFLAAILILPNGPYTCSSDMFGYALRHPKFPARNGIANNAGFTPLTLACQLGRAEVFREMLELSAREFWRYSNITCSAYPLNALDTLLPDGRTNWNSALFIILNGTKEEHLDMLDGGIIQRLLEEKWKTFARLQFLKRLIILVFHLTTLSLAVYQRPTDLDAELMTWPVEWTDIGRIIAECITVLGVIGYILVQLGGELINIGPISFLKQLTHEPAKLIFVISNLLILACIPCRLAGNRHAEDAILVVAVPGSWFLLMFFAGAIRLTGPFVTMVYSMITGDMLTFGIIYMVMLFGFSQSFYFLYKGFPRGSSSLYHSYPSTWMALFQITLGDYNYADLSDTTYPNLSKTVFVIFMVLVPILLLNMLIAMMGNTYAHVIEQSEKEFVKQWAKIVVSLERAVSQKDAHNYLQEYSIKLGPGDDPNNPASEQRGVMVIKSKSKTRARQRKGAVANWKRVLKVTIGELKKREMTGEQLRCIMWGRASISTPVRHSPHMAEPEISASAGVTGGFGDALTAALDVMAFAHDIDLASVTEGIPTTDAASKAKAHNHQQQQHHQQQLAKLPTTSTTTNQTNTQVQNCDTNKKAEVKLNGKSEKSAEPTEKSTKSSLNKKQKIEGENLDPLLNLVIASESPDSHKEMLLRMAEEARIASEPKVPLDSQILETFGLGNFVTQEVNDAEVREKKYAAESSDNDICGNSNLLGTESRLRRIRSATLRYSSVLQRQPNGTDSTSSGDEQTLQQPIQLNNIQVNGFLVPKNGITTETTSPSNPDNVPTNEKNPQHKRLNKNHKRRAKTAKNRVYPKEIICNDNEIERKKNGEVTPPSPTDPLEPWSTRGISDMNTLLAWRENGLDSP